MIFCFFYEILTTLTSEGKWKMTTYNIPKHDGFKHLNPKLSDYEKAVTGIFNEMKLRQQDKDVENMQRSNLIIKNKMMFLLARSNAKWDH